MAIQKRSFQWIGGAAVTLLCAGLLSWVSLRPTQTPAPDGSVQKAGLPTSAAAIYRVVREWDGKLAVFLPEAGTPEEVYEVWVSALPEEEQRRLAAGIGVSSRRELQQLLEDYTG